MGIYKEKVKEKNRKKSTFSTKNEKPLIKRRDHDDTNRGKCESAILRASVQCERHLLFSRFALFHRNYDHFRFLYFAHVQGSLRSKSLLTVQIIFFLFISHYEKLKNIKYLLIYIYL